MGEGQIPITVQSGCSSPAAITSLCWFTRTSRGTSESFVQPPRGESHSTGFLKPFFISRLRESFMRNAWPACVGFRVWNAYTASAPFLTKAARSSSTVKRAQSSPSLYLIRPRSSTSPPRAKSLPGASRPSLMYGCSSSMIPHVRMMSSRTRISYTSGSRRMARGTPAELVSATAFLPSIDRRVKSVMGSTMGMGMDTRSLGKASAIQSVSFV